MGGWVNPSSWHSKTAAGAGNLRNLLLVALAMPVAVMIAVRAGLAEFRRFGQWGKLENENEGRE